MPYVFTDKQTIRRMLGISDGSCGTTRFDQSIEDLQPAVEQIMLDELGLTGAGNTNLYHEMIDVDFPQTEVPLRYTPVSSVVALTIGGTLQTASVMNSNSGTYILNKDQGIIKLEPMSGIFPIGRAVVEISYYAGWGSVPNDLKYAGNLIAVSLFNQQGHVGLRSERTQGYSYTMDSGKGSQFPSIAERILSRHRRVFVLGLHNNTTS